MNTPASPAPKDAPESKKTALEGGPAPQSPGILESIAKGFAEISKAKATATGYTAVSDTVAAVVFLGVTITLATAAPSIAVPVVALLLLGGIAWRTSR
ncbi:hypothetical protein OH491_21840 [Termitidicoccus mucosus]|uniref:hypothetical protein n=1 Tax=Termitidicoccus mucosus TaxID=1184151 RepID=UPI0008380154